MRTSLTLGSPGDLHVHRESGSREVSIEVNEIDTLRDSAGVDIATDLDVLRSLIGYLQRIVEDADAEAENVKPLPGIAPVSSLSPPERYVRALADGLGVDLPDGAA
jgi:hypothetical protein